MRMSRPVLGTVLVLAALTAPAVAAAAEVEAPPRNIQVGPRSHYLVDNMEPSPVKTALEQCSDKAIRKTNFSIGHRGAALQFPEHTKESYVAAARMGAGILECDVTFTKDRQLVCRHSQCDLHTTTDILVTPLAAKCSVPFTPAVIGPNGNVVTPATAQCCTSDITLSEFKTLKGKSLDVQMTPELKAPGVPMPFQGTYTQAQYAQQMIDEYKAAGVLSRYVWPQSFSLEDVLYWIEHEPAFGKQAVFLDDAEVPADLPTLADLRSYRARGIRIVAPPLWALVGLDGARIVPSQYARDARAAGLDIITWTLERSGLLTDGGGFYYQTVSPVIDRPGDTYELLDVLARDVKVRGVFSDWPGTVTYYANCMGLK